MTLADKALAGAVANVLLGVAVTWFSEWRHPGEVLVWGPPAVALLALLLARRTGLLHRDRLGAAPLGAITALVLLISYLAVGIIVANGHHALALQITSIAFLALAWITIAHQAFNAPLPNLAIGTGLLLGGVAMLLGGVALLRHDETLVGIAGLLYGAALLLLAVGLLRHDETLVGIEVPFGVAGLLLGAVMLLFGVGVLRQDEALVGVAGLLFGAALLLLGAVALRDGDTLAGAALLLFGVAMLLAGVTLVLVGVAIQVRDTLIGVAVLLIGTVALLCGVVALRDGHTLGGVALVLVWAVFLLCGGAAMRRGDGGSATPRSGAFTRGAAWLLTPRRGPRQDDDEDHTTT